MALSTSNAVVGVKIWVKMSNTYTQIYTPALWCWRLRLAAFSDRHSAALEVTKPRSNISKIISSPLAHFHFPLHNFASCLITYALLYSCLYLNKKNHSQIIICNFLLLFPIGIYTLTVAIGVATFFTSHASICARQQCMFVIRFTSLVVILIKRRISFKCQWCFKCCSICIKVALITSTNEF